MSRAANAAQQLPPARKRSGSAKRQKTKVLRIRLDPAEAGAIHAAARAANMTDSAYGRSRLSGENPVPGLPLIAIDPLVKLYREMAYNGNNLNQATRALNVLVKDGAALDDGTEATLAAAVRQHTAMLLRLDELLAPLVKP